MTEAKKILEMVENVSPDDTDTLDEIDALSTIYALGWRRKIDKSNSDAEYWESPRCEGIYFSSPKSFTRSRDALKSIRPTIGSTMNSGFLYELISTVSSDWVCSLKTSVHDELSTTFESKILPTEELAELHAIIQAIEWTRQNDR